MGRGNISIFSAAICFDETQAIFKVVIPVQSGRMGTSVMNLQRHLHKQTAKPSSAWFKIFPMLLLLNLYGQRREKESYSFKKDVVRSGWLSQSIQSVENNSMY